MDEFVLDITNVERLPQWWPEDAPKLIPLRKGRYSADYDVIEERIPGFRGKALLSYKRHHPQQYKNQVIGLPFGVDVDFLPPKARIYRREKN
ncbi:hypothetical protein [uncultured Methylophaga sp.]|uniref:hypothetical protein n=1 Tax=uncultured Methylophaga sp. TaxID=285271 RepID=UPI00261BFF67|nr:hypothetical protein [uncultured Methylophaga sp.]